MSMKMRRLAVCLVIFSTAMSFGGGKDKVVKVKVNDSTNYVFLVTDCKLMLKQTAHTLSIGGITFGEGPVKSTGTISVDGKLLQAMNAQAQILDQYQFATCQDANRMMVNDPKRSSLIAVHGLSVYTLSQLAYFAQMYGSNADNLKDALLKWIVQSGDLLDKIWSKELLASDAERASQKQAAKESLKFALDELKITPGTAPMQDVLGDPLRRAVQE